MAIVSEETNNSNYLRIHENMDPWIRKKWVSFSYHEVTGLLTVYFLDKYMLWVQMSVRVLMYEHLVTSTPDFFFF